MNKSDQKTRHSALLTILGVLIGLNFTAGYGCVTLPEGELQLGPKIVRDMKASRSGVQALNKGRPIYIEAYSYPQMLESGDIWTGGPLLINLGREDISLDDLIAPVMNSGPAQKGENK
jgi:hypothetical protein